MRARNMVLPLSAVLAAVTVSGCEKQDPVQQAAQDARDVAMVERMNRVPWQPLVPQPITVEQFSRYGLDRAACAFRKQGSGDPLFLAGSQDGFLMLSGKLQQLAARTESAELPNHARATYVGLATWVEFSALPDKGDGSASGQWPARMIVHDQQERIAFTADGVMACKP